MSRVQLRRGSESEPVDVTLKQADQGEGRRWLLRWGARHAEVAVDVGASGAGRLELHGQSRPFFVLQRGDVVEVWLDGVIHRFERPQRSSARRSQASFDAAAQPNLTAPMPGTVRKISLAAGQRFEAHQPLIIMESMKMELTLSAPRAGVLKKVLCREGQLVEMGAVLAELDEPK